MTITMTDEYRQLGYDTSNDMIRHDARRGDRKYTEAALHIRNAGLGRLRMGQMMFDAGEFAQAAADWLSAAACFLLVPDLEKMRDALVRAQKLEREGKIPPERRDILVALQEREEEATALVSKLKQFWLDYRRMVGSTRTAMPEALRFLQKKVRDLPGFPHLHVNMSDQAMKLGDQSLAVSSLEWAQIFDPGSPHLSALRASQLFALGDPVAAATVAREQLSVHPEMGALRFILAQALAFRAGPNSAEWQATDYQAAIEVLNPLLEQESADATIRLQALALATVIHHRLEQEVDYLRHLSAFNEFIETIPSLANVAAQIRQSTPQVFLQPGANGAIPQASKKIPHSAKTDSGSDSVWEGEAPAEPCASTIPGSAGASPSRLAKPMPYKDFASEVVIEQYSPLAGALA